MQKETYETILDRPQDRTRAHPGSWLDVIEIHSRGEFATCSTGEIFFGSLNTGAFGHGLIVVWGMMKHGVREGDHRDVDVILVT